MVKLINVNDDKKFLEVSLQHASRLLSLEKKTGNVNYKLPKGYELNGEKVTKVKTTKKKDDSNDSTSESVN